jgi:hypothetical protein
MRDVVSDRAQIYLSYADLLDFGQADHPTAVMNPDYLVALQGTAVQVETIYPRTGVGHRYFKSRRDVRSGSAA